MGHIHGSYESTNRFRINPFSRQIINESEIEIVIAQYDHNSERFIFELPKVVDEHDMTLCSAIRIHFINAGSNNRSNKGVYEVEDLVVSEEDSDTVTFSWLLKRSATSLDGVLGFAIQFVCTTDGEADYSWSTLPYESIKVSKTYDNSEDAIEEDYSDILEKWKKELSEQFTNKINTKLSEITAEQVGAYSQEEVLSMMTLKEVDLTKFTTVTEGEMKEVTETELKPGDPAPGGWSTKGYINVTGYCEIEVENPTMDYVFLTINGERYEACGTDSMFTTISFKGVVTEPIIFEVDTEAIAHFTKFLTSGDCVITSRITDIKNDADASALKGSASGKIVRVDDVSVGKHKVVAKVHSKNLLPYTEKNSSMYGTTYTVGSDGSITIDKNPTTGFRITIGEWDTPIELNGTYTISIGTALPNGSHFWIMDTLDNIYTIITYYSDGSTSKTIELNGTYIAYGMWISIDGTYDNHTFYPQLEEGNVATEYAPSFDPTTLSVTRHRKNLLSYPYEDVTKKAHGITYTDNRDGSITINGTATSAASFILSRIKNLGDTVQPANSNSSLNTSVTNGVCTFSGGAMYNANLQAVVLNIPIGTTVSNLTLYPQAECGTTATDYEAPTAKVTYTPASDGTVEIDSIAPTMTLLADKSGVNIELKYNRDINKAFEELYQAIISLGGNI